MTFLLTSKVTKNWILRSFTEIGLLFNFSPKNLKKMQFWRGILLIMNEDDYYNIYSKFQVHSSIYIYIYITVILRKLQNEIFFTISVLTPPHHSLGVQIWGSNGPPPFLIDQKFWMNRYFSRKTPNRTYKNDIKIYFFSWTEALYVVA